MTKDEKQRYIKILTDFLGKLDDMRDTTMETDWGAFLRLKILWQETRETLAFIKAYEVSDD